MNFRKPERVTAETRYIKDPSFLNKLFPTDRITITGTRLRNARLMVGKTLTACGQAMGWRSAAAQWRSHEGAEPHSVTVGTAKQLAAVVGVTLRDIVTQPEDYTQNLEMDLEEAIINRPQLAPDGGARLEELATAYQQGLIEGEKKGEAQGRIVGHSEGHSEGYAKGYDRALLDLLSDGVDEILDLARERHPDHKPAALPATDTSNDLSTQARRRAGVRSLEPDGPWDTVPAT